MLENRLKKGFSTASTFEGAHLLLQNFVPHFDFDICFGSRQDARMN